VNTNDADLLRRYDESGDEQAFSELVQRHLGLVHATALRQLGNPQAAADVTQAVFCLLWRKCRRLIGIPDLTGWLHRAACYKSAEAIRAERRRRFHESEAATMSPPFATECAPDPWAGVAPHLDAALERLGEAERQLILARFFRRQSLRELGEFLGVSEDAARMRVSRALDRLRRHLAAAGAAVTLSGLAGLLEEHGDPPAPAPALHDRVLRAVRELRNGPGAGRATPPPPPGAWWRNWAPNFLTRPVRWSVAGLVAVGLLTLWQQGRQPTPGRSPLAPAAAPRTPAPTDAATPVPVARVRSVVPKALSEADVSALLEDLKQILASPVTDNVWPPQDLRDVVGALSGHHAEAFEVLSQTFRDAAAPQPARERAIWGMWLLGEAAPGALPGILSELTGVVRSPDAGPFWGHAADVLRHLGPPESALAPMAAAVIANPAAASATVRFWEGAAWRHPEAVRALLTPWLAEPTPFGWVAACALTRVPGGNLAALPALLGAGLDDPSCQSSVLEALRRLGPAAAELTPALRARLSDAERKGQVWLRTQLIEVLATVAPDSRGELPEVAQVLQVQAEADALQRQIEQDTATVSELTAGLQNPKVSWMAAMTLEEMGPAAAAALPALRQALNAPGQPHRHYLAKAIKAIAPGEPKPLFERDDLLATLRAVSDAATELAPGLDAAHRAQVTELIGGAGDQTPAELARFARELEAVHPRLGTVWVAGLLALDPALETTLSP